MHRTSRGSSRRSRRSDDARRTRSESVRKRNASGSSMSSAGSRRFSVSKKPSEGGKRSGKHERNSGELTLRTSVERSSSVVSERMPSVVAGSRKRSFSGRRSRGELRRKLPLGSWHSVNNRTSLMTTSPKISHHSMTTSQMIPMQAAMVTSAPVRGALAAHSSDRMPVAAAMVWQRQVVSQVTASMRSTEGVAANSARRIRWLQCRPTMPSSRRCPSMRASCARCAATSESVSTRHRRVTSWLLSATPSHTSGLARSKRTWSHSATGWRGTRSRCS